MKINILKSKLVAQGKTLKDLKSALKLSDYGLYKKIHGYNQFKLNELQTIKSFLNLNNDEINDIFFKK